METPNMLSKYKGSVYAALAGDCIGAIYEPMWSPVPFKTLITLDQKLKSAGKLCKEHFQTVSGTETFMDRGWGSKYKIVFPSGISAA